LFVSRRKNMMKKICALIVCMIMCGAALFAQTAGAAYYVSAEGNNKNDGLTEETAFKTLEMAVIEAAASETIKTVTVSGTLNQVSESEALVGMILAGDVSVFTIMMTVGAKPLLITGLPNAPAGRRAVLSAVGTQKIGVYVGGGVIRFEHIEISGSPERGLVVGRDSSVTLGPGSVVRNNQNGGVGVYGAKDERKAGLLILDGGIVENNKRENSGGGIFVNGAFTMKRGSIRNNTVVPDKDEVAYGGGIFIQSSEPVTIEGGDITGNTAGYGGGIYISEGRVTMTGGTVSDNTATKGVGGVVVSEGATFNQRGGTISGNKAPSSTPFETYNILRMRGSFGTSTGSSGTSSAPSSSTTPTPASPPRQAEGSMSVAEGSSAAGDSRPPDSSRPRDSSVDFGFTFHLNTYVQGWHQNLFSFGIPLQLGLELKLPVVTMDFLGEGSIGAGYGNLLEYHLGGMAELYFFKKIGFGAGAGLYGNAFNWGSGTDDGSGEDIVSYEPPIETSYCRFALIFRGVFKTSLYAELYGDGKWGFGLMWGRVMTD
jgi:hypothetical protein